MGLDKRGVKGRSAFDYGFGVLALVCLLLLRLFGKAWLRMDPADGLDWFD